jgi:hypothetical protein
MVRKGVATKFNLAGLVSEISKQIQVFLRNFYERFITVNQNVGAKRRWYMDPRGLL